MLFGVPLPVPSPWPTMHLLLEGPLRLRPEKLEGGVEYGGCLKASRPKYERRDYPYAGLEVRGASSSKDSRSSLLFCFDALKIVGQERGKDKQQCHSEGWSESCDFIYGDVTLDCSQELAYGPCSLPTDPLL